MGRLRTRALLLMGFIGTMLGFVLYVVAKVSVTPRGTVTERALPPDGALGTTNTSTISHTVASVRPRRGSLPTEMTRVRPRTLLLLGVMCVILGVACIRGHQDASVAWEHRRFPRHERHSRRRHPDDAGRDILGHGRRPHDSPSAPPPVTLTTIAPAALPGRLKQTAATVGFTILGLKGAGLETRRGRHPDSGR